MKGYSRIAIVLVAALAVLAGCQSNASVSSTEIIAPAPVAAIPASPVPAPAPAPAAEPDAASAPEAAAVSSVVSSYEYAGYTMSVEAYDGYAIIALPAAATAADVDAFMANEVALYGSMLDGVTYSYDGNVLTINYPAGVSEAERRAYVNMFVCDVIAMASSVFSVPASTPVSATYSYQGYELTAEIGTGSATLVYPDFITAAEAEGFFAVENAAYGDVLGSVHYSIEGAGKAVFTYPETVAISDVLTYTSLFVTDLIAYVG